jgi:hypothetical protein
LSDFPPQIELRSFPEVERKVNSGETIDNEMFNKSCLGCELVSMLASEAINSLVFYACHSNGGVFVFIQNGNWFVDKFRVHMVVSLLLNPQLLGDDTLPGNDWKTW